MGERTQVNFQVHPESKKEWESFADSEGLSLSAMIRQAVSAHVNEPTTQSGEATDPRVSEVMEQNKRLESMIGDLTEDIVHIKNAIETPTESDRELTKAVFRRLPTDKELQYYQDMKQKGLGGSLEESDSGAIVDIATSLNVPESDVRDAIDRLQSDTNQVSETVRDGQRRFYR